jgi:hypothetical protein
VNKGEATECYENDVFCFCTGMMVSVGHVACTENERYKILVKISRGGIILDQFGIGHINMRMKVKPSSYIASFTDNGWGSRGKTSCILFLSTSWRHNIKMKLAVD